MITGTEIQGRVNSNCREEKKEKQPTKTEESVHMKKWGFKKQKATDLRRELQLPSG